MDLSCLCFGLAAVFALCFLAPGPVSFVAVVEALDNGLARTPPMGWLSWARFTCETDCQTYPEDCISEQLYRDMADHLVADGYKDVGYQYVNIDDCWPNMLRDPSTRQLVPNRTRFPDGIDGLANYVHAKGLKLGIYGDIGTNTCAGYPGFFGGDWDGDGDFFMLDSESFALWGVDSLKVDGCYADTSDFSSLYPRLGNVLNLTGAHANGLRLNSLAKLYASVRFPSFSPLSLSPFLALLFSNYLPYACSYSPLWLTFPCCRFGRHSPFAPSSPCP